MKKEYIIYKLSEDMKNATRIENELFKKFDVKRGLRNEDGTGVLVGLSSRSSGLSSSRNCGNSRCGAIGIYPLSTA